jgi:chromosome segregation ATPase
MHSLNKITTELSNKEREISSVTQQIQLSTAQIPILTDRASSAAEEVKRVSSEGNNMNKFEYATVQASSINAEGALNREIKVLESSNKSLGDLTAQRDSIKQNNKGKLAGLINSLAAQLEELNKFIEEVTIKKNRIAALKLNLIAEIERLKTEQKADDNNPALIQKIADRAQLEESINTIDRWTSTINVRISNYQRTIDSALRYSGGYVRDYSSIRRSDTNLWDFGKYY